MRPRRIVKRIVLGLLAFIAVAIAAVLVLLHTDYGRGLVREQVEARLDEMFVGGASVGTIEGSPFGTLVVHDVVLNGPDGEPVISIERLELELGILPLFSQKAQLSGLVAEGVVVDLRRDEDGALIVDRMLKPGPKSTWSVDIPDLELRRARIAYDTGSEVIHLDDVALTGSLQLPYDKPLDAAVVVRATWRERAVALELDAAVHHGGEDLVVPRLAARAGDVTVTGTNLSATLGDAPVFGGSLVVTAPRAGVTRLVPQVDLPGDLALRIDAIAQAPVTHVELDATLAGESLRAIVDANVGKRAASGLVTAGELDLAALTDGAVVARGGGIAMFDLAHVAGKLPAGTALIHGAATYQDYPRTRATIALTSDGDHVTAKVGATNPGLVATLDARIRRAGDAITLERSTLVATARPAAASNGKAPVYGTLDVNLAASGALTPKPSLAVAGRIDGRKLRMADLRVAKLSFAIDAKRLPARPLGRLELAAEDIERGDMVLRELTLNAADRPDGKIGVTLRTRPKQDPWLVEADAIVTPGKVVTVDLTRHRVRAGTGTDWTGERGRVVISEHRIDVSDLDSRSADGAIAIAGNFQRRTGDLAARVTVDDFKLGTLSDAFAGILDARIDLSRRAGKLAGTANVDARGIALEPNTPTFDANAKLTADADRLAIVASAGSPKLGRADLTVDIDAPKDAADVGAWKRLGRSAIRTGRLELTAIDLAQVAKLANLGADYAGRIDGNILISSTSTGGLVRVREVMLPRMRALGMVNVDLHVEQCAPDELAPTAVARVGSIGVISAEAKLRMPDHLFDPAAWRSLGRGAVRYAAVRAQNLAFDPALIDRIGFTTYARGTLSFSAEFSEALADAKLKVAVRTLRGSPIAQPVDVDLIATIDGTQTTAVVDVKTRKHEHRGKQEVPVGPVVPLVTGTITVPLTFKELERDPGAALAKPLAAKLRMPNAPAQHVLAVFSRHEITGGVIDGTIDIAGTVDKPTVRAKFLGTNLQVPPGPGGRPVKTVQRLALDAAWDGTTGKLALDGTQADGTLHVEANGSPDALAAAVVTVKAKRFDLQPVLAFAPGPAGGAAGQLDADLSLHGLDPQTAKLTGRMHLERARVPIAPQVGTLRRATIDVVIGATAIDVKLDGRLGPGTVKGTAKIGIAGAMPTGGEGSFSLRGVQPIGAVEPHVDADVALKLRKGDDRWIADLTVTKGLVKVPEGRGEELKPVGAPTDMVFITGERITNRPMEKAPPARPTIVANIVITPTFVESDEIRGVIRGKLQVTTDGTSVGITGLIEAERGTLDLFGHRYEVERANVRFDGSPDPLLDLRITHEYSEVTTVTEVRGRLSKPELAMSSNPGTYSQGQLLGFLLGGEPNGTPGDASDRATAAGASFIANRLGGYMKRALPIDLDVLRYESASPDKSAAVTVGTWLTRDLFLAYRRRLEARPNENANEGDLEYWLSRRSVIEGVLGDRGYNGVDLLWRKRY